MGVSILSGTMEGQHGAVFVSRTTGTCFGPLMDDEDTAHAFSEYLGEDPRAIPEDRLKGLYVEFATMIVAAEQAATDEGAGEIRFVPWPHQHRGEPTGRWMVYDSYHLEIICENLPSEAKAKAISTVLMADEARLDEYKGLRWSDHYEDLR